MGSKWLKRGRWYIQFRDPRTGKQVKKATGLPQERDGDAQRMLEAVEARIAAGEGHPGGVATVASYSTLWLEERRALGVRDVVNDKARLRLHILPHIGEMPISKVRPRHLIAMVKTWRTSSLAPKTVRNLYSVCKALFRDAVIEDLVDASPAILTRHHLGEVMDADPEWRATARFMREELELLISDLWIPPDRQVMYGLAGIAGLRHGEAAGLRWRHYEHLVEPLGRITIATSYDNGRTKTGAVRLCPAHPVLAALLAEWRLGGWQRMMGRAPSQDDLVVPLPPPGAERPAKGRGPGGRVNPRAGGMRSKSDSWKRLDRDLQVLGLRHRRFHDLRRTMVSLAQDDGARRDILKLATHGRSRREAIDDYTSLEWETLCTEIAKLRIERRPMGAQVVQIRTES